MKNIFSYCLLLTTAITNAQFKLIGNVTNEHNNPVSVALTIKETDEIIYTDVNGMFEKNFTHVGNFQIDFTNNNHIQSFPIQIKDSINYQTFVITNHEEEENELNEIIVHSIQNEIARSTGLVAKETYTNDFFKKTAQSNIFESLAMVNGVKPQVNCGVCNTGDIHINGLEGPYTYVLIDGMPLVSGLATVYGLSGIPNQLIEKVEVIKGPASSIYGSEAIGGMINIVTKNPNNAPRWSADVFGTSWGEVNTDIGVSALIGKKINWLMGVNYFNYLNTIDNNKDGFTDLTLQDRISIFQKFDIKRKSNKQFSVATRYFYEDRWGGQMNWNKNYRGGNEVYGESIYTNRWELLGIYQLPTSEDITFQTSLTGHDQNSMYGETFYKAKQTIAFGQLLWKKKWNTHDVTFGFAYKYQYYNDNSVATKKAENAYLASLFVQDEWQISNKWSALLGVRLEHHNVHKFIPTPRFALRYETSKGDIFRLNAGTGFRVVSLFTEDHAALSGSRDVIVEEKLNPEKSWNANFSYLKQWFTNNQTIFQVEASAWYTYFSNAILPDYDTNPNQIIYKNLDGHSVSKGISANLDIVFPNELKATLGTTIQDVVRNENGEKERQKFTDRFTGNWAISYPIKKWNLAIDYTANLSGGMELPLLNEWDPRKGTSETFSIHNIQFTFKGFKNFEIYAGVKNLTDFTINRNNPFIIARSHDPFDKNVQFDSNGSAIRTTENPYGLVFDPTYVYGPFQGRRTFLGLRFYL